MYFWMKVINFVQITKHVLLQDEFITYNENVIVHVVKVTY